MKVHELIRELLSLPNQEAEVKLIAGNTLCGIKSVWNNSRPVIIEGNDNDSENRIITNY